MRLTGAMVLRDGTLQRDALCISDGRIAHDAGHEVDLDGYTLLPGIIDMHGDTFERHIAPRPTAPFPIAMGLASVDRELAANGVTTAWLAQGWSWEGGLRGPDYADKVLAAVDTYCDSALTDMRIQLRVETHMPDTRERLIDTVRRHGVDYVVFNDHLSEAMQMVTLAPHRLVGWAEREGGTIEVFITRAREAKDRAGEVPRHLNALACAFENLGVICGSHDDPDGETRDMFNALGAHICEFPLRANPAAVAHAYGDAVVMGAPNVVRGGSQSGNASALSLIERGLCDILVSDYHYPTLHSAAFALADKGTLSLAKAWEMISTTPARVMKLTDRGTLTPGKRADIVVLNSRSRQIEATISHGRFAFLSGALATRFAQLPAHARLAAE
ncbi:alpha-D-ribose 1-methylphosphonate 5-triphosphate diphosphatase [Rhodobacteraceae bacterium D3-12]|nr:alpha-D-ribose 1-methylphosphonate 5-triphosphate diphosphatase [Rhodobacteraceae bacterium D3-12]